MPRKLPRITLNPLLHPLQQHSSTATYLARSAAGGSASSTSDVSNTHTTPKANESYPNGTPNTSSTVSPSPQPTPSSPCTPTPLPPCATTTAAVACTGYPYTQCVGVRDRGTGGWGWGSLCALYRASVVFKNSRRYGDNGYDGRKPIGGAVFVSFLAVTFFVCLLFFACRFSRR